MAAQNIMAYEGTRITVERVSSPSGGTTGILSPYTRLYVNDVIRIGVYVESGYELTDFWVQMPLDNTINYTQGQLLTVTSDIAVGTYARKVFYLDIASVDGVDVTVRRGNSPEGGDTGWLQNGAKIYERDALYFYRTVDPSYELISCRIEHPPGTYTDLEDNIYGQLLEVSNNVKVRSKTRRLLNLYIAETNGATISVERLNSMEGALVGALESNATLYEGDILQIKFTADVGYEITNYYVEQPLGTPISFASGGLLVVSDNVSVSCEARSIFALSITQNEGAKIVVERISSPDGGTLGLLSHGTRLFDSDVLQITFSAEPGYEVTGYMVEHPAGLPMEFESGDQLIVTNSVAVRCSARRRLTITITETDGVIIRADRVSSKEGAPVGALAHGDRIYVDDVISIVFSADDGQEVTGYTVEQPIGTVIPFESGGQLVVTDNIAIRGETRNILNLSIIEETGSHIVVKRIRSSEGIVGTLNNGDRLYVDDVLTITFSCDTGYEILARTVEQPPGTVVPFENGDQLVVTNDVLVQCLIKNLGIVHIFDAGELRLFLIFIDNGVRFEQYCGYMDNGDGWDPITL